MKKSVKIILSLLCVIMAAVCVCCVLYIVQYVRGNDLNERLVSNVASQTVEAVLTEAEDETGDETDGGETATGDETKEAPQKTFKNIDFAALSAINGDIYAWIDMPGTVINYAVVQSEDENEFYSDHSVDGSYYSGGSIFSQRYNKRDFTDPVTVLYGHNRKNGTMFAALNDFADPTFFEKHKTVYIYIEGMVYEYTVFAAYPHSSEHLLLNHDFTDEEEFTEYFGSLKDGVNTNYDRDMFPLFGDKVLTLSTCYKENRMQRYLVQAKLTAQYSLVYDKAE